MNIELKKAKPKIAILSLKNSYGYGGVLSSLKIAYSFLEKYFEPTVFFVGFDPAISTSIKRFKFSSSSRKINYFGMNCVEVGARWAFWEPGHYRFNLDKWEELLGDYKYFFAVSGTCIVAHPLALLNKKFGVLISTPYNEDRDRRVQALSGFRYLIDRFANEKMCKIEKFILSNAKFIWALSNYSKSQFQKLLQKPCSNMVCCGHPVSSLVLPELGCKERNVIIAVGRFSDPRKNIDMLLRAFDKIYTHLSDSKLYVIGSRPDRDCILKYSEFSSFKNVTFVGQVGAAELESFYKKASLMLITSYQEGFGIVGVEALLHGIPIISTDCGGPADFVINDMTGYLVDINDVDKMSEFAIQILTNQDRLNRMSSCSQAFAFENYSIAKIEKIFENGLLSIYPELKEIFESR